MAEEAIELAFEGIDKLIDKGFDPAWDRTAAFQKKRAERKLKEKARKATGDDKLSKSSSRTSRHEEDDLSRKGSRRDSDLSRKSSRREQRSPDSYDDEPRRQTSHKSGRSPPRYKDDRDPPRRVGSLKDDKSPPAYHNDTQHRVISHKDYRSPERYDDDPRRGSSSKHEKQDSYHSRARETRPDDKHYSQSRDVRPNDLYGYSAGQRSSSLEADRRYPPSSSGKHRSSSARRDGDGRDRHDKEPRRSSRNDYDDYDCTHSRRK